MIVTLAGMARHPLAEKLEQALEASGKNVNWLAKVVGIPRQSIYKWIAGDTSPRDDSVWDRLLKAVPPPILSHLDRPRFIATYQPLQMRFAGIVPASDDWGDPLAAEEFVEVDARYASPKRFAAQLVGDSCWPALHQGDLTIWHVDPAPGSGLIVLAQRLPDFGCTVKQLKLDDSGRPLLVPINSSYNAPPDGDGWSVLARLVAVIRRDRVEKSWYEASGLRPEDLV